MVNHFHDFYISRCPIDLLFKVIIDVENYPEFVPGCKKLKITSATNNTITAIMDTSFVNIKKQYTSEITFEAPNQSLPAIVKIKSSSDIFEHMTGTWKLKSINNSTETLIDFNITFKFKSATINKIVKSLQANLSQKIILAFQKRAINLMNSER